MAELKTSLAGSRATVLPKMKFSMKTPETEAALGGPPAEAHAYVLFGIEAHVCVQQTALDNAGCTIIPGEVCLF